MILRIGNQARVIFLGRSARGGRCAFGSFYKKYCSLVARLFVVRCALKITLEMSLKLRIPSTASASPSPPASFAL